MGPHRGHHDPDSDRGRDGFGETQPWARLAWFPYDFKKSEFTSIPLGARIGKVFSIGKQPVNAFLQSWYNAADSGADYTVKFNFTFLFPVE